MRLHLGIELERALELLEQIALLEPDRTYVAEQLFYVNQQLGRESEALASLMSAYPLDVADAIGDAYERGGWHGAYREVLRHQQEIGEPCGHNGPLEAFMRLELDDRSGVMECLEAGYRENRLGAFQFFQVSPIWDPLRDEPRFQSLMEQMNLDPWADLRAGAPG